MTWQLKETIKQTSASETYLKKFNYNKPHKLAFIYPNTYEVGMSNLGLHILYNIVNSSNYISCERFFLPDKLILPKYLKAQSPVYSIETQKVLLDFDFIAVTMSFELDYFNLLTILELGKINPVATERHEKDPLIIIGGPCATFNPEPLSIIGDVFIIGEGEETLPEVLQALLDHNSLPKQERLAKLAEIPGVYIPILYQPIYDKKNDIVGYDNTQKVSRRWVANLEDYPNHSIIVTDKTEFARMFIVEVSRGCGRHCRFCMAGYAFRYPRIHDLDKLKNTVSHYFKPDMKVGLMGPAVSDYPYINDFSKYLIDNNMKFSVASLRADTITPELLSHLIKSGQRMLTIAPEAASQQLRDVINKCITDEDISESIQLVVNANMTHIKLYIMIGLPEEDMSDIKALVNLARDIRQTMDKHNVFGKLVLSINTFIPKPTTPFQWLPMQDKKTIENKLSYIRQQLKSRNITINFEPYRESIIQAILAKGDRRVGQALIHAHRLGGQKLFVQALQELGLDIDKYIYTKRKLAECLPWDNLSMGFDKDYLWQEYQKSILGKTTIPCFSGCRRCGICSDQGGMKDCKTLS